MTEKPSSTIHWGKHFRLPKLHMRKEKEKKPSTTAERFYKQMWDRLLSFFFLILPKSLKFTSSHRRRKLRSFRERRIWSANRNRTRKYRHFNRLRDSGYKSVPKMILILDGVVKTEERIIIWFFFSYPAKKEGERHSFILFLISFFCSLLY